MTDSIHAINKENQRIKLPRPQRGDLKARQDRIQQTQ